MRNGGQGIIETGKLKGLKFLLPSEVLVEKGNFNGIPKYAMACLIHEEYTPAGGCGKCKQEVAAIQAAEPQQQEVTA